MLIRLRKQRLLFALLVVMVFMISQVMPINAQAVIERISITNVDYSRFPFMTVRVQILDESALPITGITRCFWLSRITTPGLRVPT